MLTKLLCEHTPHPFLHPTASSSMSGYKFHYSRSFTRCMEMFYPPAAQKKHFCPQERESSKKPLKKDMSNAFLIQLQEIQKQRLKLEKQNYCSTSRAAHQASKILMSTDRKPISEENHRLFLMFFIVKSFICMFFTKCLINIGPGSKLTKACP